MYDHTLVRRSTEPTNVDEKTIVAKLLCLVDLLVDASDYFD